MLSYIVVLFYNFDQLQQVVLLYIYLYGIGTV